MLWWLFGIGCLGLAFFIWALCCIAKRAEDDAEALGRYLSHRDDGADL